MTETEYRLETSARSTLDVNGAGSVLTVGPTQPGERWEISLLSATGTATARLQVIRGNSFNESRQLDITDRADSDTSPTDIKLQSGESISFWWTRGTAGAQMTCGINGQRYVRGQRAY